MSDTSTRSSAGTLPTLVEAGTRFEGLVAFRGAVRVEGLIVGSVVAVGSLWLGQQGELRGRIEADEVTIEGCCDGEIEARHRIELLPGARVRGRMVAPLVVMADGSLFDGEVQGGSLPPAARTEDVVGGLDPQLPLERSEASISA